MTAPDWRLIHCDESAIVAAIRTGGQAVIRFVLLTPAAATSWTFAVDDAAIQEFVDRLVDAWRPADKTIIGPAPTPATEGSS